MKVITKTIIGILILQLFSCQVKVLTTDFEKMQLKKNIQFVFEQTFELFPINDYEKQFVESIDYSESEYWEFNQTGYIIEHGRLIAQEDSIFHIQKYTKDYPHNLEQMIRWFSDVDTMNLFVNTKSSEDTTFKKIYFSDSTLYWSEISIKDKRGSVIEWFLEKPPLPRENRLYYSNGLIKEKIIYKSHFGLTKVVYKYKDLNLISKTHFYKNGDSFEHNYTYTFDKNMNWISQVDFFNGEPSRIKIRILKYFEE